MDFSLIKEAFEIAITQIGTEVTFTRGNGSFANPVTTETTFDCIGIVQHDKSVYRDGAWIKISAVTIPYDEEFAPQAGDQLTVGELTFRVGAVTPVGVNEGLFGYVAELAL